MPWSCFPQSPSLLINSAEIKLAWSTMDCATQQDLRKTMSSSLKRRLTADSGSERNFQHQQISLCVSSDAKKAYLIQKLYQLRLFIVYFTRYSQTSQSVVFEVSVLCQKIVDPTTLSSGICVGNVDGLAQLLATSDRALELSLSDKLFGQIEKHSTLPQKSQICVE